MEDCVILDGLSKVGALPLMKTIVSIRPYCVVFLPIEMDFIDSERPPIAMIMEDCAILDGLLKVGALPLMKT